jgi:hypothetical protein
MPQVKEISLPSPERFAAELAPAYEPFVIRGMGEEWPLVKAAQQGASFALKYVRSFDTNKPTEIMLAQPSVGGRFFYNDDMRGFNFERQKASLSQLAEKLEAFADHPQPPGIYAGATALQSHLPGLEEANALHLLDNLSGVTPRIWMGNATQVATHFDLSDNFAIVGLGKRRFTLFPPSATKDLYVGPLDVTPAGQPVSMVDPVNPDLERYPDFARAQPLALTADLGPGDGIYIPTLWWHHVNASEPINILLNFWHNDAAHGGGFLALVHALLSIRDLPLKQKEAWRDWFDHFIFNPDASTTADHLPLDAQGINGPATEQRGVMMRRFIAQVLVPPRG